MARRKHQKAVASAQDLLSNVRLQLDECARMHKSCVVKTKLRATLQNLKLIDCTQRTVVPAPPDCVYLTLSYVWSNDYHPFLLNEKLPQTIEDSITTVLRLGYRYLWIDRFVRPSDKVT